MFETGGIKSSMIIAVPIQAFEPVFDDKKLLGQKDRRDSAVVWKAKLFDQIENIQVPVTIELGSTELPLATVEGLQVGDELVLPVKNSNLNVFVEGETHLLNGAVEVVDNGFKLRISNAEKSQG
jgi:flagellar motor switch protein FliM